MKDWSTEKANGRLAVAVNYESAKLTSREIGTEIVETDRYANRTKQRKL